MDIYIGRNGSVIGPYEQDEILRRLEEGGLDGNELAWHEGLDDEWVNVKEVLEDEAPAPEAEETSVETVSTEEPEPLDEETLEQVNKIKELIADGHPDTAWQLIRSLNNPRIYEGLLEDCPVNDDGWVSMPVYWRRHAELFIKLLGNLSQSAWVKPGLRQLTKLDLHNVEISDVSPLNELTQLTHLNLSHNGALDLNTLKELKKLKELSLGGNHNSNVRALVDALKELKQLVVLNLWGNMICDASPLKELAQLTHLDLSSNQKLDLNTLKDLKELEGLGLRSNEISDVRALVGLTQLKELDLANNKNLDLSPVSKLTRLKLLKLSDNEITDLTPLAELKGLEKLYLAFNRITDLTPLAELTKLEFLVLGEWRTNPINWSRSESVRVPETNRITDLKPLTGLKNLRHLTVYRRQDSDLSKSEILMLAAALPQCSIVEEPTREQKDEEEEDTARMFAFGRCEGPLGGRD